MTSSALRLSITGRVQGVGYRLWAAEEAWHRHLRGWVRNRRDGSVEMLLIGDDAALAAMVEACRRGPAAAQVTDIRSTPAEDDGTSGFEQRPTG